MTTLFPELMLKLAARQGPRSAEEWSERSSDRARKGGQILTGGGAASYLAGRYIKPGGLVRNIARGGLRVGGALGAATGLVAMGASSRYRKAGRLSNKALGGKRLSDEEAFDLYMSNPSGSYARQMVAARRHYKQNMDIDKLKDAYRRAHISTHGPEKKASGTGGREPSKELQRARALGLAGTLAGGGGLVANTLRRRSAALGLLLGSAGAFAGSAYQHRKSPEYRRQRAAEARAQRQMAFEDEFYGQGNLYTKVRGGEFGQDAWKDPRVQALARKHGIQLTGSRSGPAEQTFNFTGVPLKKKASIFGAAAPEGSALGNRSIPYGVRKAALKKYLQQKAKEQPSSLPGVVALGAGAGGVTGLAALGLAKKRGFLRGNKRTALLAALLGAGAGGLGGAGVQRGDAAEIRRARRSLGAPGGVDDEFMRRLDTHVRTRRQRRAARAALQAASSAYIAHTQEQGKTNRLKLRQEAERENKRENMLRDLEGNTGAESAARGLFGKSLAELNTAQLSAVKGTLG